MAAVGGLVLSGIELGLGAQEAKSAKKDAARAAAKRRAYQTPEEVYKVLQATEQNAQSGLDPFTLSFATNQVNQTFSDSATAAEKLGGDPNDLSLLFNNKVNAIMGIESTNHQLRTQNFSQYLSALDSLGKNKDAEFFSQQNLVKDDLQKAAEAKKIATAQINSGITTGVQSATALAESLLYTDDQEDDGSGKKKNSKTGKRNNLLGGLDNNKGTFSGYGSSTFNG